MIDLSKDLAENLVARPGCVVLPVWLAAALVKSCGAGPAMNFGKLLSGGASDHLTQGAMPVGLLPDDLELMPHVLAEWLSQVEAKPDSVNLHIDSTALRQRLPGVSAERVDAFCTRLFGLRLVHGGAGVTGPFFENEIIENFGAGGYVASLSVRRGMLVPLLGFGTQALPAIIVPRRLWDDLSVTERGWLIVVEAAARWKFSWVREDGCVEVEVALPPEESLADSLKPLALLGRKLVDHGWLAPALDDAPVLFESHDGASALRLMWVLHASRAVLSQQNLPKPLQAQVLVPQAQAEVKRREPQVEAVYDGMLAKMRLVAAEELKKIRSGTSGQYLKLKQRYFDSLDSHGLQIIRCLEQTLAPEVLEEHLRHGLVRYMCEHPSAWQSAGSEKHPH